jgi:hypothetical protein
MSAVDFDRSDLGFIIHPDFDEVNAIGCYVSDEMRHFDCIVFKIISPPTR